MADRVLSIDFGSSFTKVCLRTGPDAAARAVELDGLRDDLKMCVPSAVVVDRARGRATCGPAAAERVPGPQIEVHQNWKKRVFTPPDPLAPAGPAGLDALLASDEFAALAAKFQVPVSQGKNLQRLATAAGDLWGLRPAAPPPPDAGRATLEGIAVGFFTWLHKEVRKSCERHGVADFDAIPAVVSVPALGPPADPAAAPGVDDLRKWLAKAGWTLHPQHGVLTEPYSNAVGVLTRGANAVMAKTGKLNFGKMFDKGPLTTVLREPGTHPLYRAVVVDVGSFTTDFAAVALDTQGDVVYDPHAGISVAATSIPLGVSDLDERVLAGLSADAARAVNHLPRVDWAQFQVTVYSDGKGFLTGEAGEVGGKKDGPAVRAAIDWFAGRLHEATAAFCRGLDLGHPQMIQELVLTGGGNHIPAVRQAVRDGVAAGGVTAAKTHWPGRTERQSNPPVQTIDDLFVRGGSAVGGASIYFDRAFW